MIYHFSSCKLKPEEEHTLSFSLDDHIPIKQSHIKIKKEFESFYYNIVKHTNHLDQRKQYELKSKIYRTFGNYSQVNAPYKYHRKILIIFQGRKILSL